MSAETRGAYLILERRSEAARRVLSITGALGLGIALGTAVGTAVAATPINPWVIGGTVIYTLAMMAEGVLLTRQVKRAVAHVDSVLAREQDEQGPHNVPTAG